MDTPGIEGFGELCAPNMIRKEKLIMEGKGYRCSIFHFAIA
jgi:hypothetical protein